MRPTAVVLAVLGCAWAPAWADRFEIVPGKPNQVRFESRAPLESFEGKTDQVRGHVDVSFDSLSAMAVRVEVDLASLDTGIELRNKHMRENHLHTDKFPTAVFLGDTLSGAGVLRPGETGAFKIRGRLELHGVQKPVEADVELTRAETGLHIKARFVVKLPDFEIPRPKFLLLQLDDMQRISVDLVAKPAEVNGP